MQSMGGHLALPVRGACFEICIACQATFLDPVAHILLQDLLQLREIEGTPLKGFLDHRQEDLGRIIDGETIQPAEPGV